MNYWAFLVKLPKAVKNFHPYHRDGAMRIMNPSEGKVTYSPNSYGEWQDSKEHQEPALELTSGVDFYNFRDDDDNYYEQPGKLFRLMTAEEQQRLFENTASNMQGTTKEVQLRHINNCYKVHPVDGEGVVTALGIDISEVEAVASTNE